MLSAGIPHKRLSYGMITAVIYMPLSRTTLLADTRFLEGPQRSQRCLLRLGHPPDSCNIEPLVRAISPQCAQMFAALQLPDVDRAIVPATGERAAIGTHLERLDCPLVRPERVHALSALDIPPAEHAVAVTADQHRAGRTPSERIHDLAQFAQRMQELSTVRTPD